MLSLAPVALWHLAQQLRGEEFFLHCRPQILKERNGQMKWRALSFQKTESKKKAEARGKESMKATTNLFFVKGCPDAEDSPDLLSTWTEQQEVKAGDVRGRKDRQRKRKSGCVDACRRKREEQLR